MPLELWFVTRIVMRERQPLPRHALFSVRDVHRAEFLIASQEALVAQLRRDGHDELATRGVGCSTLDNLRASLALARADLAELEGTRRPSFLEAVALRYAQFSNKT